MSYKTDEQLLEELAKLPDVEMSPEAKQKIITTIRSKEAHNMEHIMHTRRFNRLGKGLAVCSILVAVCWMGATLIQSNQPAALPEASTGAANGGTPAPSAPQHEPGPGKVTHPAAPTAPQSEALLNQIRKEAKKGAVINAPFTVETTVFDAVEKAWGAPDSSRYSNGLTYAAYAKRNVVIGYNKGMQIADIRSLDPRLQKITLAEIEQKWGKPNRVGEFAGQQIYTYDVTDKYQVKFAFEPSSGSNAMTLVSYSVYYPQGNRNLMADLNTTELLTTLRDLAKNGQTLGSEFHVEKDVFDTVEQQWGKPDLVSYVNGITYNTYRDRGLVFGFNKGMQIVDIRSYNYQLQYVTLADVVQTLGKPQSTANVAGQTIYTYKVSDSYELKIVFSGIADGTNDTKLFIDHVNVFYPRGTINNMAG
ncbi:YjgB family protein [Brevibacillus sp. GCM10020057]|uniref:YjgB family protein n=1 Tax=Brevibacillus sp. GCM10020057 TaxID=3317327 RepID=UPI0036253BE2